MINRSHAETAGESSSGFQTMGAFCIRLILLGGCSAVALYLVGWGVEDAWRLPLLTVDIPFQAAHQTRRSIALMGRPPADLRPVFKLWRHDEP